MKSLQESLFDTDLVSKETGIEKLYSLVERAKVFSEYFIDWLDKPMIKRDFCRLIKTYKEQDWNGPNGSWWTSMRKVQNLDEAEILRELLYVIVCQIDTSKILNSHGGVVFDKLKDEIVDTIGRYIRTPSVKRFVGKFIDVSSMKSYRGEWDPKDFMSIYIQFNLDQSEWDREKYIRAGSINILIKNQI